MSRSRPHASDPDFLCLCLACTGNGRTDSDDGLDSPTRLSPASMSALMATELVALTLSNVNEHRISPCGTRGTSAKSRCAFGPRIPRPSPSTGSTTNGCLLSSAKIRFSGRQPDERAGFVTLPTSLTTRASGSAACCGTTRRKPSGFNCSTPCQRSRARYWLKQPTSNSPVIFTK